MCIEEEIECLACELAEIKSEKIDANAYEKLQNLIEECKKSIRDLNKEIVASRRLRGDYLANCKAQIHSIQQKANNLISVYQNQFVVLEF